ncbi:MAG: RNA polymerase sigma factor [Pirellulaceae bacterium]
MADSNPHQQDAPVDVGMTVDARMIGTAAEGDQMLASAKTEQVARDADCGIGDVLPVLTVDELLRDHHQAVFSYAFRLTGNAAEAEDVSQEVFIRALRNLHQLREPAAARGWLFVITRNEFVRWCKKYGPKSYAEPDELAHGEDATSAIDRAEWVQEALQQLPLDYRLVVNMFYFEQLSYTEIAEQLSIPMGTVMSRLNRGRAHLKKSLNSLAEPRPDRYPS